MKLPIDFQCVGTAGLITGGTGKATILHCETGQYLQAALTWGAGAYSFTLPLRTNGDGVAFGLDIDIPAAAADYAVRIDLSGSSGAATAGFPYSDSAVIPAKTAADVMAGLTNKTIKLAEDQTDVAIGDVTGNSDGDVTGRIVIGGIQGAAVDQAAGIVIQGSAGFGGGGTGGMNLAPGQSVTASNFVAAPSAAANATAVWANATRTITGTVTLAAGQTVTANPIVITDAQLNQIAAKVAERLEPPSVT